MDNIEELFEKQIAYLEEYCKALEDCDNKEILAKYQKMLSNIKNEYRTYEEEKRGLEQ